MDKLRHITVLFELFIVDFRKLVAFDYLVENNSPTITEKIVVLIFIDFLTISANVVSIRVCLLKGQKILITQ